MREFFRYVWACIKAMDLSDWSMVIAVGFASWVPFVHPLERVATAVFLAVVAISVGARAREQRDMFYHKWSDAIDAHRKDLDAWHEFTKDLSGELDPNGEGPQGPHTLN